MGLLQVMVTASLIHLLYTYHFYKLNNSLVKKTDFFLNSIYKKWGFFPLRVQLLIKAKCHIQNMNTSGTWFGTKYKSILSMRESTNWHLTFLHFLLHLTSKPNPIHELVCYCLLSHHFPLDDYLFFLTLSELFLSFCFKASLAFHCRPLFQSLQMLITSQLPANWLA